MLLANSRQPPRFFTSGCLANGLSLRGSLCMALHLVRMEESSHHMRPVQKIFAITVVLLLGATVYGFIRTSQTSGTAKNSGGASGAASTSIVDQTTLKTAEKLAKMPTSEEELPFAQDALQIADKDMDLAYAAAKRELEEHPVAQSPAAKQIEARLKQAEDTLAADDALVERLTSEEAKATGARKDDLHGQFVLAQATQQEHQDEVDEAK